MSHSQFEIGPLGAVLWNFGFSGKSRYCPALGDSPVRINELVRKSIVFLGILDDTGAFAPYGTGFIVSWPAEGIVDRYWHYLVTAKHVVDAITASKRLAVCRVNGKDGMAQIGKIDSGHWRTHPVDKKCDIAVTMFLCSPDTFDFRSIELPLGELTAEYIVENDIGCGDEVYTAGLLVSHFGRNKNVPIIRSGTIAAMPDEHVDLGTKLGVQDVYLIESRSLGGLSGSPVFLQTPAFRIKENKITSMSGHHREYILGVNIGLFETSAHGDKLPTDTETKREHFLEAISAGIAVVVPIRRTMEIIREDSVLKEVRESARKLFEAGQAFVPTLAPTPVREGDVSAPASDENPEAGFFEHGRNRLVMPGVAAGRETPPENENPRDQDNGGRGGGGGGPSDPLIRALIQKLPEKGPWSTDDRLKWMKMAAMAFDIAYGDSDGLIEVTKTVSAA